MRRGRGVLEMQWVEDRIGMGAAGLRRGKGWRHGNGEGLKGELVRRSMIGSIRGQSLES